MSSAGTWVKGPMMEQARDQPAAEPQIVCENLVKIYKIGTLEVVALQGLDLRVAAGEMVGIVGKSGSGKSTLLAILGGYAVPSAGKVRVAGHDLLTLSSGAMTRYRRRTVGFVWQQTGRNLLPYLTALQNVEQPLCYAGAGGRAARGRATELLGLVGLSDRLRHKPADLSGGEQQRVAIAVALANSPRILLADEPTGELDSRTAQDILRMLQTAQQQLGVTVIVVTHDAAVGTVADRLVAIRDGRTSSEQIRGETTGDGETAPEGAQREYAVVDRTGRLQIPQDYLRSAGITDRAVLRLEGTRIVIEPVPTRETPAGPDGARP
ncbi:MAG TPA: ABC transporter ATP-binding protein [Chloroflexota bacterium]|nr:ABC transporter ATP-binding protein [Chloroflexota bacterium]